MKRDNDLSKEVALLWNNEGHTFYALGKILETPKPVSVEPEWEDDSDKLKINYDVNVKLFI